MDTFLGSLVQSCCGEGGTLQTNNTRVLAVSRPPWVCPHSQCVCFHSLHCSDSRLLCQELSEVNPGLHALPTSKLLRFKYSGTPQRHILCWACVLCPSQVRAVQVMRCLASAVPATYRLTCHCRCFPGCTTGAPSQAVVDHPESQEVLVSREACLQFGK